MKQTAVEWLVQQLRNGKEFNDELIKQAKQMEKEQMIEFANNFAESDSIYCSGECAIIKEAEQYYKENFKSE